MILPGHVAAPVLASRYLDIDRRIAVIAGVMPDLVDKSLFYVLHATRWGRVPAHSPLALGVSTLVVALAGWLLRRDWRWGASWVVGYGLHLLCDLLPPRGSLPWLWPLERYAAYVSDPKPWFLGGGPVPWFALVAEIALVAAAVAVTWADRRGARGRSAK